MDDLRMALVKADFTIHQEIMAFMQCFLYPVDTLKPGQFNIAGFISQLCHQPSTGSLSNDLKTYQFACHLYKISIGFDLANKIYFGFIYMPVGEMIQKIIKSKNAEFFFQQVAPLGPNAF
jgi:hypothetical protein